MNITTAKKTIQLINQYIDKNYFWDKESIETQKMNRDNAAKNGQDVSMYPDELIEKICLENSLRRSFYNTALPLYNAIKEGDKKYLIEHLRYDQKFSKHLFFLYTGKKLPNTNKEIHSVLSI